MRITRATGRATATSAPGAAAGADDDALAIATLSRDHIETGLPWRWTPARVARAMADSATNVAVLRVADGIGGFGIMKYGDEDAHLLLLAVHPSQRRAGAGVGSALLQWLEAVARAAGVATVWLEARADRPAVRAFYRHNGYREVAHVPGMYCGMIDGLQLRKDLRATGACDSNEGEAALEITAIVRDNHARFLRYRQGNLYYAITVPGESIEFMFPVPLADLGDASVHAQEKAILLLRYIRKAMDEGSFVPVTVG